MHWALSRLKIAFGIQLDFPSIYRGNNGLSTALELHNAISQIKEPTYSIILPWALGKQIEWFHNFPGSVHARKGNLGQNTYFIVEYYDRWQSSWDSFMFIKSCFGLRTHWHKVNWRDSTTRKMVRRYSGGADKVMLGIKEIKVLPS